MQFFFGSTTHDGLVLGQQIHMMVKTLDKEFFEPKTG